MTHPLLFLLAPAAALPSEPTTRAGLQAAQDRGPAGGFSLRIFSTGRSPTDLSRLPVDGRLTGDQPRSSDGTQLLCDALLPQIEPQRHWLGVYRGDGEADEQFHCVDRFALSEAGNETCWFYPTHDGTFLSWERGLRLTLTPGAIVDCPDDLQRAPYDRGRISLLWSLLGDDASLTCVGLTYGGQRIHWPLGSLIAEPMATWSRFCVNSAAEDSLVVQECLTVFSEPAIEP
ncbi:hypothetical protein NZK33_16610 [Cyanobium sp. FGCU-6]|nr:hypothetical protein [Cyanobium sp. FGCU6]